MPLIKVLVVDGSAAAGAVLSRRLENDPEIEIVGQAVDGFQAVGKVKALKPDVVTLDIEMAGMDGLTALQQIVAERGTAVILVSADTYEGAEVILKALELGAIDFVLKPTVGGSRAFEQVVDALLPKVKLAARANVSASSAVAKGKVAQPGAAGTEPAWQDRLVVIGSSTGGPQALRVVLASLPADTGVPVLAVQHMPEGFTRPLAERLNGIVALPVEEAQYGSKLTPGRVLIAPANFHMILDRSGEVRLTSGEKECGVRPSIDVTMESAAEVYGSATVGVVLTGMGSDGTRGAGVIKEAGGRVIVQDEASSVVYGMPRSVVEAGYADRVVPLGRVASEVVRACQTGSARRPALRPRRKRDVHQAQASGLTNAEFASLTAAIRRHLNIDIEAYKSKQIRRRLAAFFERHGGDDSIVRFCNRLKTDEKLISGISAMLTIDVSEFFRDTEQFEYLRSSVLPELLRGMGRIKIWSAGCGRGQEPYSVAILLAQMSAGHRARIVATDLDRGALKHASEGGPYSEKDVRNVPEALLKQYFTRSESGFTIGKPIRRRVTFRRHDLIKDEFEAGVDLLICRNTIIYFTSAVKSRLARQFFDSLKPGGILFTGGSEALLGRDAVGFQKLYGNFCRKVGIAAYDSETKANIAAGGS